MSHHLAQINVGSLVAPTDSPVVAEFMEALAPINALAEGSPGFVWRLQDDDGEGATGIKTSDDPLFIVNMSVWESVETLREYVYKTVHVEYLRRPQGVVPAARRAPPRVLVAAGGGRCRRWRKGSGAWR